MTKSERQSYLMTADGVILHDMTSPAVEITAHSFSKYVDRVDKSHIAILIPAYNEELTIGSIVLQARSFADIVLVVNDGSEDKTSEIARAAGAEVIDSQDNNGKASALDIGFNELMKRNFDVVVMVDGDGQHDIEDIPLLISPILEGEADLVIGSRFMKKDNSIPLYRQIGQRILNRVTNFGLSEKITDTQSGFRALNRNALSNMNFKLESYAIEQDMIIHCHDVGLRIAEVPISVRYDVPNGHNRGSFRMGVELFNSLVSTIGYRHPLLLFGIPGFIFFSIGLIIGLLMFVDIFPFGTWALQSLISGFMIILGIILVVSALSLNSLALMMKAEKSTR